MPLFVVISAGTATAGSPYYLAEDDHDIRWRDDRAFFEWSTWIRLGFGVERTPVENQNLARSSQPPSQLHDQTAMGDAALGADVTLPIPTSKVRLGPWIELRPQGVFGGAEVSIAGDDLDMFMYDGERVYTLRAGSSMTHLTGAFAFGYRCPWKLWGPYSSATRYMIGARLVASATRSVADPNDWSMSLGIEFEPIGALRYVGAIKSWY
ncbi:MAG TPA: hypothetical protein VIV11_11320 [Kofleriaceae bacterium]